MDEITTPIPSKILDDLDRNYKEGLRVEKGDFFGLFVREELEEKGEVFGDCKGVSSSFTHYERHAIAGV